MYEAAKEPNDLEKFFVERANAGDIDGLVALYEPNAVLLSDDGRQVSGTEQIRMFLVEYLRNRPELVASRQNRALCSGDVALTSSQHSNGVLSVEIARRQPDGNWLWVIDQFAIPGRCLCAAPAGR